MISTCTIQKKDPLQSKPSEKLFLPRQHLSCCTTRNWHIISTEWCFSHYYVSWQRMSGKRNQRHTSVFFCFVFFSYRVTSLVNLLVVERGSNSSLFFFLFRFWTQRRWHDTSANLELWPAARFMQLSPQVFNANDQLGRRRSGANAPRVYSYVWQTVRVCLQMRMCTCQKLALTSSLLSCMFYLTNGETMVLSKSTTPINNHEAKLQGSAAVTAEMIGTMQMQGTEPIYSGS